MTYKDYKFAVKRLKEENSYLKTSEEKELFIKEIKRIYGKCVDCSYNDGIPHGECWGCD